MIDALHATHLFFWLSAVSFVLGVGICVGGKALTRALPYLLGAFSLGVVGLAVWARSEGLVSGWSAKGAGWIGPRGDSLALSLSAQLNESSAILCALVGLVFLAFSIGSRASDLEMKNHRLSGAAFVSLAGALLSCCASGIWLALLGFVVTSLGGVLSYATAWDVASEAAQAARHARDSLWAAGVAALGGCLLVAASGDGSAQTIGVFLVFAASLASMRPGPLAGWMHGFAPSPGTTGWRLGLAHLLPAFTGILLLSSLGRLLPESGIFPLVSPIAALAALSCALASLLSSTHRQAGVAQLGALGSFALAICARLGFESTPWIAGMFLLAGACLALSHAAFEFRVQSQSESALKKARWSRGIAVVCFLLSHGAPGFFSARLWFRFFAVTSESGLELAFAALTAGMLLLAGLFVLRDSMRSVSAVTAPWPLVLAPLLLAPLGLAVAIDGTASGGLFAIPAGDGDVLVSSSFHLALAPLLSALSEDALSFARGFYLATWFGILLALWLLVRAGSDRLLRWKNAHPLWVERILAGFGVDAVAVRGVHLLARGSQALVAAWDQRVWGRVIPTQMQRGLSLIAKRWDRWDQEIRATMERAVFRWIEIPTQALQLLQNGDLRWYVFWSVLGMLLLLLSVAGDFWGKG